MQMLARWYAIMMTLTMKYASNNIRYLFVPVAYKKAVHNQYYIFIFKIEPSTFYNEKRHRYLYLIF